MTNPKILPAEWATQSGVMLTWPHKQTDFASELTNVEFIFCEIASIVSQYEKVIICSNDEERTLHIHHLLSQIDCNIENIHIFTASSNDSWARDHGPITILENDQSVLLDFKFNGWGNKFQHELDNAINTQLATQEFLNPKSTLRTIDFILEGGSIESDGQGTLLTTSQCLLTDSRNSKLTKNAIEQLLKEHLGVKRILWLEHGQLLGDDTDSHIDMLARFINNDTICYMACKNKSDPHYAWLNDMKAELESFKTDSGQPYNLVELPFPNAILEPLGQRLPASYCNFLITNKVILAPVYGCPQDELAIEILKTCFPQHEVIAINCLALIKQHGSLHCITMQLPHGVLVD